MKDLLPDGETSSKSRSTHGPTHKPLQMSNYFDLVMGGPQKLKSSLHIFTLRSKLKDFQWSLLMFHNPLSLRRLRLTPPHFTLETSVTEPNSRTGWRRMGVLRPVTNSGGPEVLKQPCHLYGLKNYSLYCSITTTSRVVARVTLPVRTTRRHETRNGLRKVVRNRLRVPRFCSYHSMIRNRRRGI